MQKFLFNFLLLLIVFFVFTQPVFVSFGDFITVPPHQYKNNCKKSEIIFFIRKISEQYNFDKEELIKLFNKAKILPSLVSHGNNGFYEKKSWYVYELSLVNKERVKLGIKYWKKHKGALTYIEQKYGIPKSILIAIIGIESLYGHKKFRYPTLNVLITLSFFNQNRPWFFQNELINYLLLTKELFLDPEKIYGSCAGAIGVPQFMPSNYRSFAITYNNKSAIPNLFQDTDDVAASVANFLNHFGWKKDEPIVISTIYKNKNIKNNPKILLNKNATDISIKELKKYGIQPQSYLSQDNKIKAILALQLRGGKTEYWLGLHNFRVLLRYNNNSNYVMAVFKLSQKLEQKMIKTK